MAVPLTFDVLPALNEGDERIPLSDILAIRDDCLTEEELYAVCKECCLALQNLHSSDMFQALCITPDTLAFDTAGGICFLDSHAGEMLHIFLYDFDIVILLLLRCLSNYDCK